MSYYAIFGQLCLIIALLSHLLTTSNIAPKKSFTLLGSIICWIGFAILLLAFVDSDFSLKLVYEHSHTLKPLLYKITGTWGNHEGSLLLLICIFGSYHAFSYQKSQLAKRIEAALMICFLLFLIITSNPFTSLGVLPLEGLGLNPLLQDIGLALHPPILYIGYGACLPLFAMGLSALWQQQLSPQNMISMRQLALISWSFLSLGIGLGSWWAYRELGWGGYWFWDPVENVSLLPWLTILALIHAFIAAEKKQLFIGWAIGLSLLGFVLAIAGFFLVRSGILTSVHAFASDPTRGVFILLFLSAISAVSLLSFIYRISALQQKNTYNLVSKETFLNLQILLVVTACVTVFLGTIYPLIIETVTTSSISVAAPFFNRIFIALTLPTALFALFGPFLPWKKAILNLKKTSFMLVIFLVISSIFHLSSDQPPLWYSSLLALSIMLALSAPLILVIVKRKTDTVSTTAWSTALGHFAFALLIFSTVANGHNTRETQQIMQRNTTITLGPYDITLADIYIIPIDNYLSKTGEFIITKNEDPIALLKPESRFYPAEETTTTEADIYYHWQHNLYLALGEGDEKGNYVVRGYFQPYINGVWLAALLMFVAGMLRITSHRQK